MARPTRPGGDLEAIARHLESKASEWYPGLAGVPRARFVGSIPNASNFVYRFDLAFDGGSRPVLVKLFAPRLADTSKPFSHWPRLQPSPSHADSPRFEFDALSAIREHIRSASDPAFGAVRALDVRPDLEMLVLELAPGIALDHLMRRSGRLAFPRRSRLAERGFRNAGRWLRHFHAASHLASAVPYRSRRHELVTSIHEIAEWLTAIGEDPPVVRSVAGWATRAAESDLPERLPTAPGHGDFWPGNVLVDQDGRVTVLDTYARWRIPVYEDIAYFLVNLRAAPCQVATLGAWIPPKTLRAFEGSFLGGYFGDAPPPRSAMRPFEALVLLNKWGLAAHNARSSRGFPHPIKTLKMAWRRRHFVSLLEEMGRAT